MSEWNKSGSLEAMSRRERERVAAVQNVVLHINGEKVRHVDRPRHLVAELAAFVALRHVAEVLPTQSDHYVLPESTESLEDGILFNPVLDHEGGHYLSIALRAWDVT